MEFNDVNTTHPDNYDGLLVLLADGQVTGGKSDGCGWIVPVGVQGAFDMSNVMFDSPVVGWIYISDLDRAS